MNELAIHCTIYVQNPDGWNEDSPETDAEKVLDIIRDVSGGMACWDFDYQIYDAEVRDI